PPIQPEVDVDPEIDALGQAQGNDRVLAHEPVRVPGRKFLSAQDVQRIEQVLRYRQHAPSLPPRPGPCSRHHSAARRRVHPPPHSHAASACSSASASANRPAGSFSRQRITTACTSAGNPARNPSGGAAGSEMCAASVRIVVERTNGGWPVSRKYSV